MTTSEYRPDADDPDCPTFKIDYVAKDGCWVGGGMAATARETVLTHIDRWWADNKPDRLAKLIEEHQQDRFGGCVCCRLEGSYFLHLARVIRDAGYRETPRDKKPEPYEPGKGDDCCECGVSDARCEAKLDEDGTPCCDTCSLTFTHGQDSR